MINKTPIVDSIHLSGMAENKANSLKTVLISNEQRQRWIASGGPVERAVTIPNPLKIPDVGSINYREEFGWQDKFIFGFSRNAGVVRSMQVEISDSESSGYAGINWTNYSTSSLYQDGSSNALSSALSGGRLNFDGGLSSSSHNNRLDITGFNEVSGRYIHFDVDNHDFHDANAHITEFRAYKSATANATGSFEGATITAGSSTSKMGAVITYQDNAGTNALNTDLVLKLSADNGSNYTTATLTALPDFSNGVKCCSVADLSVTAGTQLKYKIELANQASSSKECRITGVSLQY
jgi:hypothetical protein